MEINDVVSKIIEPVYALLPVRMRSEQATVMLLAIGLQESKFQYRQQIGGPARGFWQFEQGGGVKGVLNHSASSGSALKICQVRNVEPTSQAVYGRLADDDILAGAFARLLLWTDPKALPAITNAQGAWDLYARVWRPGKPHRETWDAHHAKAAAEAAKWV